ncbi:hypothetical protein F4X86_00605 [Candidatus Saccharibacteria bacterium]|nr:hypothetical protein [Candidatus Saccharibacteria bacterium]
MSGDGFFASKGFPEPFGEDLRHSSGIPSPKGDFGHTFDHLYEAYLVSIIAALTGTLRELLFPSRAGFSAEKIFSKAITAFIACFTIRRLFHYLSFRKRENQQAVMEKPSAGGHLKLAQSA